MEDTTENKKPEGFGTTALAPEFREGQPLVWKRGDGGGLETNVRWRVRHHSPTGFEIGYTGSGPADLALNAMATLFPMSREAEAAPVRCFDGNVSRTAWHRHQPFKFAFLAGANKNAGQIEWEKIAAWLAEQRAEDQTETASLSD